MADITDDQINAWRINYGLDTRSPADAMRWWGDNNDGMAPAGAVAALGLCLDTIATLRQELASERQRHARVYSESLKERDRIMEEAEALREQVEALRGEQIPTAVDINAQQWRGMDGAIAWHLIDRHGDNWSHVSRLMNAWLEANAAAIAATSTKESAAASLAQASEGAAP